MASSGYGTETTVESIWSSTWDTTQFDHINKMLGSMFNFWITDDTATDITDTQVVGMLAAETHILFGMWNAIIKMSAVTNPWDFIRVWMYDNLAGNKFYEFYSILIKKCQEILYGRISMTTKNLASYSSKTYGD
jgi:hypothetical protein